jgi:hypothetical protein
MNDEKSSEKYLGKDISSIFIQTKNTPVNRNLDRITAEACSGYFLTCFQTFTGYANS